MNNTQIKEAVGCLFLCSSTNRLLYNMRAVHKSHKLTWALWGGMVEDEETPHQALLRELSEEMGFVPDIDKIYPFDVYQSSDKMFKHYTFICVVDHEFIPLLNAESAGYGWFNTNVFPTPLHNGVKRTFANDKSKTKIELIFAQHQSKNS